MSVGDGLFQHRALKHGVNGLHFIRLLDLNLLRHVMMEPMAAAI